MCDCLWWKHRIAATADNQNRHLERLDTIGKRCADARLQRAFEDRGRHCYRIVQEAIEHRGLNGSLMNGLSTPPGVTPVLNFRLKPEATLLAPHSVRH